MEETLKKQTKVVRRRPAWVRSKLPNQLLSFEDTHSRFDYWLLYADIFMVTESFSLLMLFKLNIGMMS